MLHIVAVQAAIPLHTIVDMKTIRDSLAQGLGKYVLLGEHDMHAARQHIHDFYSVFGVSVDMSATNYTINVHVSYWEKKIVLYSIYLYARMQ